MSYYERYQADEHEAVWDELRELGPRIFEGTDLEDARLVVASTVDRLASNLDRLAEGLTRLGYEFVAVSPGIPDAGTILAGVQASAAETLLSHPGISREQAEQMLASMPQLLGAVAGSSFAPNPAEPRVIPRSSPFGDPRQAETEVAAFEKVAGPVPLVLKELWHRFGWIDLNCRTAGGALPLDFGPLAVLPPLGLIDDHSEWKFDGGEGAFHVELLPAADLDDLPIEVDMSLGADARLRSGEWLLDHLRRLTRNAGFASSKVLSSQPELRDLAKGWQPF